MGKLKMAVPSNVNQWAGLVGFGLVVLTTIGFQAIWPYWTIPAIGAFIGFSKIREPKTFLVAGLALLAAKWGLGHMPFFGNLIPNFASNLVSLVVPAMLVVSIRVIWDEFN